MVNSNTYVNRVCSLYNDPIRMRYNSFGELFSLPMDYRVEKLSRGIFRLLNKTDLSNVSQVNKCLLQITEELRYDEPKYEYHIYEASYDYLTVPPPIPTVTKTIRSTCIRINDKWTLPDLIFVSKNGDESIIQISDSCKTGIKEIENRMRFKQYDCIQFALESVGHYKESALNETSDWRTVERLSTEKNLVTGDIVVLFEQRIHIHFAIYLKKGIYLSKYGNDGIYFSRLKDLKMLYNADTVSWVRHGLQDESF